MKQVAPALGPWPGLWAHHEAAQREARERLLCERGIEHRQSPENRSIVGSITEFHRLWQQKARKSA